MEPTKKKRQKISESEQQNKESKLLEQEESKKHQYAASCFKISGLPILPSSALNEFDSIEGNMLRNFRGSVGMYGSGIQ